jgi:tetratricopeptide (TPR) repeat protein
MMPLHTAATSNDRSDGPRRPLAEGGARWGPRLLLLLALLAATAAYARVLDGQLQFDDTEGIERNPALRDLAGFLQEQFLSGYARAGRPVVDLTMALNYRYGGLEPWNYHVTNLAIHLLAVLLVWIFTRRVAHLAGSAHGEWIASAVSAAFALHPLQSQAVAYVSQRAEVLASVFHLLTVLLLLDAEQRRPVPLRVATFLGAALAFALGLGAKAIVVTAPAAYLLVRAVACWTPQVGGTTASWRTRLWPAAPLLAAGLASSVATLGALSGHTDAGFDVPGVTPWQYLLTQSRVIVVYLRLLAWPAGQNVDWDVPVSSSLLEPAVAASATMLLAMLAGALVLLWRARHRRDAAGGALRMAAVGVLWFFLVLSVSSSVVPLADVLFEHRVYLASWGVFTAAASLGFLAWQRFAPERPLLLLAPLMLVLAAWALAVHARNAAWETREALWRDAVEKSPEKARPYLSLGWAYRRSGRYADAVAQYQAGLARTRGDREMELKLLGNLAAALSFQARHAEAVQVLARGLSLAPERMDLLLNMGIAQAELGHDAEAEAYLSRAARLAPDDAWVLNALGAQRLVRQDAPGALALFERARALQPGFAEAHFNAGQALERVGRRQDACRAWATAVRLGLGPRGADADRIVGERCR